LARRSFLVHHWNQGDYGYYHAPKQRIRYAKRQESYCPHDSDKQRVEKKYPEKALIDEVQFQKKMCDYFFFGSSPTNSSIICLPSTRK
jgi:hypothetical protein